jgi:hypothetical protein
VVKNPDVAILTPIIVSQKEAGEVDNVFFLTFSG